MRRNRFFTHINISGDDYLLPTAQSISDHKRGIKINDTGLIIWDLLDDEIERIDLINNFITKAEISDSDVDQAVADVEAFIDHLVKLGMIDDKPNRPVYVSDKTSDLPNSPLLTSVNDQDVHSDIYSNPEQCDVSKASVSSDAPALKLSIAGIRIDIYGKKEYLAPSFNSFLRRDESADLNIYITESSSSLDHRSDISDADCIILNREMNIYEAGSEYIVSYPAPSQVLETRICKDSFDTYILMTDTPDGNDLYDPSSIVYQLFHAIRLPFLYIAEKKGLYAIHSASILYKDKAWLFSASAGTGKSTHAALWTATTDARNINGDLNLIGISDGTAVVFGIPWCGTSEIFDTCTHPLGGVIFLRRSPDDRLEDIKGSDRVFTLTRRCISPVWNSEALHKMISDLLPVTDSIYIKRLHCTKEPSAQKLLQGDIDIYTDK